MSSIFALRTFAFLNECVEQAKRSCKEAAAAHAAFVKAQDNSAAKQAAYQRKNEVYASSLAKLATAQANYDKKKAKKTKNKK